MSGGMTITMSASITSRVGSTPPLAYNSNSRRTTSTLLSLIAVTIRLGYRSAGERLGRARGGHRGRRLRWPRYGDPPEAGGHRELRRSRARRRRGRHMVGEQLSGLPVRHPVQPVLILLRSPRLGARLPDARPDPRVPARLRAPLRRPTPHAIGLRAARRHLAGR